MSDTSTHVLLIEEDEADAEYVKSMLTSAPKQKFSVLHTQHVPEGLTQLKNRNFDVVLLGISSNSTGLESCQTVRSQAKRTPVVVLTSPEDEESALRCLEMDMQDYLIKEEITSPLLTRSIQYAVQRKRITVELKESEGRFRATFHHAAVGIGHVTPDGHLVRINRKYCEILGYTAEEIKSLSLKDITHPDDLEKSLTHFHLLQAGEIDRYSVEKRYIRKDGSTIWVTLTASMIFDDDNNPQFAAAFVEDITPRKQAEEALRLSEARYEALYRDNPIMIETIDAEFTILSVNQACTHQLGYTPNELEGQSVLKVFVEEDRLAVTEQLRQCLQHPHEAYQWQFRKKSKNNQVVWVEETAQAIYDLNGKFNILIACQDVSERKRAEEQVIRSNRELEQFAYVASHDLQEPLRMVSSYLQLLKKKYQGQLDDKADTFIHYAVDGTVRMQNMIEGLLNYSRITTAEFWPVNMEVTFADAMGNLAAIIRENCAEVIRIGKLPTVMGDATQMLQLFQNLLSNALKYRKPEMPSRITVSAEQTGDNWLFMVKDNGIGIAPENFEKVFEIFQRLHTKEEYPGTGLGLASCKKIVEQHHGRIWLESSPDKGTTFFFTLPVRSS